MTTDETPADVQPKTMAQEIQQLAADINTFNQLALFCGMTTAGSAVPGVQLVLLNRQRTTLFLGAGFLLPALTALAKQIGQRLEAAGIDVEQLLEEVNKSLEILTRQTGA